jgi:hypothetical protein
MSESVAITFERTDHWTDQPTCDEDCSGEGILRITFAQERTFDLCRRHARAAAAKGYGVAANE